MKLNRNNSKCIINSVPERFLSENNTIWADIGDRILNSNYKVYYINWKGLGGWTKESLDFAKMIEKAKSQGKIIIFNLIGYSASSHAFVTCYSSKIIFNNQTLMFHGPGDMDGKRYKFDPSGNVTILFNQCVKRGLLTRRDSEHMYKGSGYEIYLDSYRKMFRPDRRQTIHNFNK